MSPPPATVVTRPATRADAAAINRIYNRFVTDTAVTFDVEPWDTARREAWLDGFAAPHHILVAECDGAVTGFAYNTKFRHRPAYRRSTETTVYTDPASQSRGVGGALYESLFQRIAQTDLHRAYAVIALPNPRSVAFHQRFGFAPVGTLHQVGYKFGEYVDVTWFEKPLK